MSGIYQPPFLEESSAESYRNTSYLNFTLEFPNGERLNAYVDRYSPLALELTRLLYNGPGAHLACSSAIRKTCPETGPLLLTSFCTPAG